MMYLPAILETYVILQIGLCLLTKHSFIIVASIRRKFSLDGMPQRKYRRVVLKT